MAELRWNVETMRQTVGLLERERTELINRKAGMTNQQQRIDTNWKSPAGQQYQNRLLDDIATLDNIITQLDRRITALNDVNRVYDEAERNIRVAAQKLPT
ncbi:MAG: hypothetical protein FWG64_06470 [Firmicutes bacterium]|nr:hypothetical protein [Bacillota bacterium]